MTNLDSLSAFELLFCRGNNEEFDKKLDYLSSLISRAKFSKARKISDMLLVEGCSRPLICFSAYPVMEGYKYSNQEKAINLALNFYSFPYYFECWLSKKDRDHLDRKKARYLNHENVAL